MDFSNVNLWAAAIAIVLSALGAYITANRVSRASASKAALDDQAKLLENQQHALETVRLSYVALQQTYLDENKRVNIELGKSRNAHDALLNKQVEDKAECLRQIVELQSSNAALLVSNAELQHQFSTLLVKMPDKDAIREMKIVGVDPTIVLPVHISAIAEPLEVKVANPLPVPVEIKGPLPVPMTAAQVQAQADAETEAKDKE